MADNLLVQIPAPPQDSVFSLSKVDKVSMPHPYCIGAKHVQVAADQFGGMLGEAAIEAAEKQGVYCDICKKLNRKRGTPILKYHEHENNLTLFITVPQNKDLNAIPGLHEYLLGIKDKAVELGIQGFAFLTEAS